MGVLQDIGIRFRSLIYDRAERFIKNEDERRSEGLRECFNKRFIEFYNTQQLGDRGYEGYSDFNARMLFDFYDRFGEKGLELLRFHEGVKLDYGDILNLRHFVERCELIENSDKGLNRGINLALRLVDEFSLNEIVENLNSFKDPELLYTLNLRQKLEETEKERNQQDSINELEEDLSDVEPAEEYGNDYDSFEEEHQQVSDIDSLIAGAMFRSKETEVGQAIVRELEKE